MLFCHLKFSELAYVTFYADGKGGEAILVHFTKLRFGVYVPFVLNLKFLIPRFYLYLVKNCESNDCYSKTILHNY